MSATDDKSEAETESKVTSTLEEATTDQHFPTAVNIIKRPNQPMKPFLVKTVRGGTARRFKHDYFAKFSWLHWDDSKDAEYMR